MSASKTEAYSTTVVNGNGNGKKEFELLVCDLQCAFDGHLFDVVITPGESIPSICSEHAAIKKRNRDKEDQILWCEYEEGHEWVRKYTKGKKPLFCPEHRVEGTRARTKKRRAEKAQQEGKEYKPRDSCHGPEDGKAHYWWYVRSTTMMANSPAHPARGFMEMDYFEASDPANECKHGFLPIQYKEATCDCYGKK